MLSLSRLQLLQQLSRLGTVTAVAEAAHFTHSAVSQQLAQLEKETGHKLLRKAGRGVELTEQGRILVDYADKLLMLAEEAESQLGRKDQEVSGRIRIAGFQTALAMIVPRALTILNERFPKVDVAITQEPVEGGIRGLHARSYDMIIGEDYKGEAAQVSADMHRETLIEDPMRLVLPLRGPMSEIPDSLADLAEVPWALDPEHSGAGRWQRQQLRAAGFEPKVRYVSQDAFLQNHLVLSGHAASILPSLLVAPFFDDVRILPLPGDPVRTVYTVVRAGMRENLAIVAMREALAEAASEESPAAPQKKMGDE